MYLQRRKSGAIGKEDKRVFGANDKGARWMFGRAFAVYVIANETLCADAVHRELPGEGRFIHDERHQRRVSLAIT